MPSAAIVTIGNELVSGDTVNTNGSWLAQRLEALGVSVRLIVALPDEIELIAPVVREHAAAHDVVVVTGGLGGTPDDVTREAVAAAFAVDQREHGEVAAAASASGSLDFTTTSTSGPDDAKLGYDPTRTVGCCDAIASSTVTIRLSVVR